MSRLKEISCAPVGVAPQTISTTTHSKVGHFQRNFLRAVICYNPGCLSPWGDGKKDPVGVPFLFSILCEWRSEINGSVEGRDLPGRVPALETAAHPLLASDDGLA